MSWGTGIVVLQGLVHGQFLVQHFQCMLKGDLRKKASDIETDELIYRFGVDILQSVYKFSGVLDSVGVSTRKWGQDSGQFFGQAIRGRLTPLSHAHLNPG